MNTASILAGGMEREWRMNSVIYSTYDWLEVEEDCISDEQLIEVFVGDIHKTVYVVKGGAVSGVISHGDFYRHNYEGLPLVQKSFTKCTLQDEEKAEEILKAKANIYGIPVVDEGGHIVREWRKEVREEECGFSNRILFSLYDQFLSDRDDYLNIMVMDLSEKEDAETAEKINKEAEGKLIIIDRKDILKINKYFKDAKQGVIYDCIQKYAGFNDIVYKRLGVKVEFIKKVNVTKSDVDHALEFYGSVGILSSEAGELSDEYKQTQSVCVFDDEQFIWNEDENCFEYKGYIENDKIPEILWVSCCIIKNPCVIYKDGIIPIGSNRYSIYVKYYWVIYQFIRSKFSDYDIAYNIIPRLNENKIKFIILSSSCDNYEEIRGFDTKEAEKRYNLTSDYNRSLFNSFFNLSACVFANEFEDERRNFTQVWSKRGYREYKDCKGKHMNYSRGER
ncbi:MAG: hypothetical protein HDR29_02860, partial [Lachnospiraceae bacterium]|nr:hypothetical protein [Lachnospiraceae bacterium]